jgi:hypothetical protein
LSLVSFALVPFSVISKFSSNSSANLDIFTSFYLLIINFLFFTFFVFLLL